MRDHPRSAVHDLICISCNGGRKRPPFCPFSPELPLMRRHRSRCFADLRPHKLQATLRSAYVRLSQSRGAKLALLEPHAIPRPAASGRSRPFRCSSSPNCKRFAGLQFASACLAGKSRQKEALRPRKLHIPRPAASGRPRPFRCSSSPNCKRFAGLQFGFYIARCRARFF